MTAATEITEKAKEQGWEGAGFKSIGWHQSATFAKRSWKLRVELDRRGGVNNWTLFGKKGSVIGSAARNSTLTTLAEVVPESGRFPRRDQILFVLEYLDDLIVPGLIKFHAAEKVAAAERRERHEKERALRRRPLPVNDPEVFKSLAGELKSAARELEIADGATDVKAIMSKINYLTARMNRSTQW